MAKEIESYTVSFTGTKYETWEGSPIQQAVISYVVRDDVNTDIKKEGRIVITESPENVTWASAETSINTAEGIE